MSSLINIRENRKNREWQERMANSAHQREVADLRKAGLNPILSATGGHGAPTPATSGATVENPLEGVGQGVSSAGTLDMQKRIADAQIGNMNAETAVKAKTIQQIDSTIELNRINGALSAANAAMVNAKLPWQQIISSGATVLKDALDKLLSGRNNGQNRGLIDKWIDDALPGPLKWLNQSGDAEFGGQSSARPPYRTPSSHHGAPVYTPGDPSSRSSVHPRR